VMNVPTVAVTVGMLDHSSRAQPMGSLCMRPLCVDQHPNDAILIAPRLRPGQPSKLLVQPALAALFHVVVLVIVLLPNSVI
jgi:hypothetical protein